MDEIKKNYFAIIPADVRYDERLTANAKLLYGEITALCNEKGYCWATNDYFANLYGVTKKTVSRYVSELVDCGYITNELFYADGTKEVEKRIITLKKDTYGQNCLYPMDKNVHTPMDKNVQDNNTNNNNTNNKKEKYKKEKVVSEGKIIPPSLDMVTAYCNERGNGINPQAFINFYESKGWMVGKNKMKNWKSAIGTWETNNGFHYEEPKKETVIYSNSDLSDYQ